MYSKYKPYIISVLLTFIFAILGGIVTYFGMPSYESVEKPFLTPPSYVFPIVWTVLFLLMAFGAALIFQSNSQNRSAALLIYAVQLTFNFWWTVFFFGLRAYLFSFIWLIILIVLVSAMIVSFYKINHTAGLLQIFYLIWLVFAAYLNFMVWFLNK